MNDEWRSRLFSFSSFATSQIQPTIKLPTTRRRREGGVGRDRLPNSASSSTSFFFLWEGDFCLFFWLQDFCMCDVHSILFDIILFLLFVLFCALVRRDFGTWEALAWMSSEHVWTLFKSRRKEKMVHHRLKDLVSPPKEEQQKAFKLWKAEAKENKWFQQFWQVTLSNTFGSPSYHSAVSSIDEKRFSTELIIVLATFRRNVWGINESWDCLDPVCEWTDCYSLRMKEKSNRFNRIYLEKINHLEKLQFPFI